jgi:hypothetical protein
MEVRKIQVRLEIEIPAQADATTVERLAMGAGRQVAQDVIRQAAEAECEPTGCPKCGKKGRSRTVR